MPHRDDCCAQFEEDNFDGDPDYRMKIELNTPRIHDEVRAVLQQEKRINRALKNNKQLTFPCTCSNLCSYTDLIKFILEAFNKLYREYEDLHEHYTTIFRSYHYEIEEEAVVVHHNSPRIKDRDPPPPPSIVSSNALETGDLEEDIDRISERKYSIIHEMIWEESCEGYVEAIRFNMIQVSRTKWSRFIDWLKFHIWGRRICTCFYCNYRDVLTDFRDGLLRLHLEYIELYAQYLALLKSIYSSDARQTNFKSIELLEDHYGRLKIVLESQTS